MLLQILFPVGRVQGAVGGENGVGKLPRVAGQGELGAPASELQPGLPVSVWTVDVAEQGRFEWNNVRYGLRTVARHVLDETPQGCRLTVDIEQTGVLEPAIRLVYGRLIRHHLEAMTVQLKEAAEAAAQVGEPSAPVLRDVG